MLLEDYESSPKPSMCTLGVLAAVAKQLKAWEASAFFDAFVDAFLQRLARRMHASGFRRVSHVPTKTLYDAEQDCLLVLGQQGFRHPDCSWPVGGRLDLCIYGCGQHLGRVNAQLSLRDVNGMSRGVLANAGFSESFRVVDDGRFDSVQEWEDHVLEGLGNALEASLDGLAVRAVAHLERVTSQ
jgi:hypothetical protein